jgi:hypothetical protein
MWRWLLLVCVFLFGCGAHAGTAPTEVRVTREFEHTLHVDTALPRDYRRQLEAAARAWREVTAGRVRISLAYDLDLDSIENLREHDARASWLVIGVLSEMSIVAEIDRRFGSPTRSPLALTSSMPTSTWVFLILDRIPGEHIQAVAMHEFGHVIGLPDLAELGAVMSGVEVAGHPVPTAFQPQDIRLCRAARYCD